MKFKEGDRVRCIGHGNLGGAGWQKDREFIVRKVTKTGSGKYVVWPAKGAENSSGVFNDHLELCVIVPEDLFEL